MNRRDTSSNDACAELRVRIAALSPAKRALLARRLGERGSASTAITRDRLVAYIVPAPDHPARIDELSRYLQEKLPLHMVPSAFEILEAMPRTLGGKLDRQELRRCGSGQRLPRAGINLPRTPLERSLHDIWADVLGLEHVGIDEDFFDIGGHSLAVTQVASRIRDYLGIELPLRWVFDYPTIVAMSEAIEENRWEATGQTLPPIDAMPRSADVPLSYSQERVWFLQQLNPASLAYIFPTSIRFSGPLDVSAMERALSEFVRRHEVFRTTFPSVDGMPIQRIHPAEPISLRVEDVAELARKNGTTSERVVERIVAEELSQPFDVAKLPLVRWTLLRLDEEEHMLIHIEHHLIHDGWSYNVFISEFVQLYRAFANGQHSPLEEPQLQFADFALWQRDWIESGGANDQLAYWKQQLAGSPPALELPYDHPRPPSQTFVGTTQRLEIPRSMCEALRTFSRSEGTTLFMTMLAGFAALMSRYSGQQDVCIGSGIANRRHREIESMTGMMINNIVLRTSLEGDPTARELIDRVREITLEAYSNQDVPFDKVVEAVAPTRDPSRNPLFQVMFAFHDSPMTMEEVPDLEVRPMLDLSNGSAKFDMNVIVVPHSMQKVGLRPGAPDEGLTVVWEYNTALFEPSTISRYVEHYLVLLRQMMTSPDRAVSTLPIVLGAERERILGEWAGRPTAYPRDQQIHRLFESQADATPDAIAASFGARALTYRELNRRSNQLARHLQTLGVGRETIVGVCLCQSTDMVVALVAILKAGGAYAPLDSTYPKRRLAAMLEDARASFLITTSILLDILPEYRGELICLDREAALIDACGPGNLPDVGDVEDLAYVIHTSGSTGRPKGIGIPHRAVTRLVRNTNYVELDASDRFGQVSNFSFDAATFEIWGALLNGGCLVGIEKDVMLEPRAFAAALQRHGITTMFLTSALFNQTVSVVPDAFRSMRNLLVGGEAVDPRRFAEALAAGAPRRLFNAYGPTESTTFTTCQLVESVAPDSTSIPIGRPISNTQVYVLDRHFEPVPIGVEGELYVGGDGLARGYLNRPAHTAEMFVPHPFSETPGARLYRTGDRVRYRDDGQIEFLGRLDGQIKLRGFRIELGEIEVVLARHPAIGNVVVVLREERPGERRLVAYLTPARAAGLTADAIPPDTELRRNLRAFLPDYMVPSAFVVLESFPCTANGKLDRRALPAPAGSHDRGNDAYVAPSSHEETVLADIWCEVIGAARVGVHDNFFELGGHSLQLTQVLSRLRRALKVELPLHELFEEPTIAGVVQAVERARAGQTEPTSPAIAPVSRQPRRSPQ